MGHLQFYWKKALCFDNLIINVYQVTTLSTIDCCSKLLFLK